MTDDHETWADDPDQSTIRLLRLSGTRPPVPAARADRVRAAVHAEWKSSIRRRAVRRRLVFVSVMFAVLSAGAVLLNRPWIVVDPRTDPVTGEDIAVVERIDGGTAGFSLNDVVRSGDWIETDDKTRVALRFLDGTSLRLDAGSRLRPLAPAVVELSRGAVYIDTGPESGRFEVRTALATARDIGTQFEVRVIDESVRLRVRTGAVELTDRGRSLTGREGTEIMWSGAGVVSRSIVPHGPDWEWTALVAPPMHIEGVALADFLARVGREHGIRVRYADPRLHREAEAIILHGSVDGLSWPDAVDVAIRTSGLRHRLESASLLVLRAEGAQ
jgi:ferric-dicitrate binding protein FerR (iron transport regulator)